MPSVVPGAQVSFDHDSWVRTRPHSLVEAVRHGNTARVSNTRILHFCAIACMLLCMRTTVDLDDELFRRAKQKASEDGVPLRSIIERALRTLLDMPSKQQTKYRLKLKSHGGGLRQSVNLENWSALRDLMDGLE